MRTVFIIFSVFAIASAIRGYQRGSDQAIYPEFSLDNDELWHNSNRYMNEDSDEYRSDSYENSDEDADEAYYDSEEDVDPYKHMRRLPEDGFKSYYGQRKPNVYYTDSDENSDDVTYEDNDRDVDFYRFMRRLQERNFGNYYGQRRPNVYGRDMNTDSDANSNDVTYEDNKDSVDPRTILFMKTFGQIRCRYGKRKQHK